jgi:hypothetical protein
MRKRIKHPVTTSIDPDNKIKDLRDEKPKIEIEKKKELTFSFDKDYEKVPLSDAKMAEKLIARV